MQEPAEDEPPMIRYTFRNPPFPPETENENKNNARLSPLNPDANLLTSAYLDHKSQLDLSILTSGQAQHCVGHAAAHRAARQPLVVHRHV